MPRFEIRCTISDEIRWKLGFRSFEDLPLSRGIWKTSFCFDETSHNKLFTLNFWWVVRRRPQDQVPDPSIWPHWYWLASSSSSAMPKHRVLFVGDKVARRVRGADCRVIRLWLVSLLGFWGKSDGPTDCLLLLLFKRFHRRRTLALRDLYRSSQDLQKQTMKSTDVYIRFWVPRVILVEASNTLYQNISPMCPVVRVHSIVDED